MGTWIEILNISFKSPLTVVVPLVGTWIEICEHRQIEREPVVVPLVGTWIEIYNDLLNATIALSSFPSWERGLKSKKGGAKWKRHRSFPSWERGLKYSKAGLRPKIRRTSTGKCCEWCNRLTGVYDYEAVSDTGNDVFRRHKHCRCTVEYDAGDGKVTNVHTKKTTDKKDINRRIENAKEWSNKQKSDKIKETPKEKEKRIKEENGLDLASRISGHPKMLSAYTPRGLYYALKESGYEIKPLKGKNYRDIPFEEGGGYKINFGGDGILMYHPGERSHHGGEYYKISTGKEGTRRYDREGNEIKKDR